MIKTYLLEQLVAVSECTTLSAAARAGGLGACIYCCGHHNRLKKLHLSLDQIKAHYAKPIKIIYMTCFFLFESRHMIQNNVLQNNFKQILPP